MISITPAEFEASLGRYREVAEREPVIIADSGAKGLVLLSTEEYDRLKERDREALYVWELSDEDLRALEAAEAPEETARYDHEVT